VTNKSALELSPEHKRVHPHYVGFVLFNLQFPV